MLSPKPFGHMDLTPGDLLDNLLAPSASERTMLTKSYLRILSYSAFSVSASCAVELLWGAQSALGTQPTMSHVASMPTNFYHLTVMWQGEVIFAVQLGAI